MTAQLVANFIHGGAASNVLARRQGARVVVVDIGIKYPLSPPSGALDATAVLDLAIAPGTRHFLHEPAMTTAQAEQAQRLAVGRRPARLCEPPLNEIQ